MTTTIELDEQDAERLLTVLEKNVNAAEPNEALYWDHDSASRIELLWRDIKEQT